jgi:tRNA nucleotidyltransferase/poly(A) polymerase
MGAAASQLSRVSPERIRDELLQIVALPAAGELWRYSAGLGALAVALPPLGETDLVARSAERLDALVALEAGLAEGEPGALAPYGRRWRWTWGRFCRRLFPRRRTALRRALQRPARVATRWPGRGPPVAA